MNMHSFLAVMNDATETTLFCAYCLLLVSLTDWAFRERKPKKPDNKNQGGDRK